MPMVQVAQTPIGIISEATRGNAFTTDCLAHLRLQLLRDLCHTFFFSYNKRHLTPKYLGVRPKVQSGSWLMINTLVLCRTFLGALFGFFVKMGFVERIDIISNNFCLPIAWFRMFQFENLAKTTNNPRA